jgi:pimeloyl-ACP methyl ester carboxylesterase
VVLLHGWPQTRHAWRKVTGRLRPDRRVLAYDLPGIGESVLVPGDVSGRKWSIAGALHADLTGQGIHRPVLVGHDIGALVAHAYARRYPAETRGVLLLDQPLPGIAGWETALRSPSLWHIGFHRAAGGVAELLVAGREQVYFRRHLDRFAAHPEAITDDDVTVYARGYRDAGRLSTGLAWFRTFPLDEDDTRAHAGRLDVPIRLAFAEYSYATLLGEVVAGLRESGASRVSGETILDCGHWPCEEQPGAVAAAIENFLISYA